MAKQIKIYTFENLMEYNGVRISFDLLEALTTTSRPGVWFSVVRDGDLTTVTQKVEEQI